MKNTLTAEEEARYKQAVAWLQELGHYVLQRKDQETGEWRNVGPRTVRGKKAALERLTGHKKMHPQDELRVLLKEHADIYRSAFNEARRVREEQENRRPPLMFMPDNL